MRYPKMCALPRRDAWNTAHQAACPESTTAFRAPRQAATNASQELPGTPAFDNGFSVLTETYWVE